MSMYHYIAANKELSTGSFGGRNPKVGEPPKVIKFKSVMFKNPYIYQLSASWGSFIINEKIKNWDIEHYKANLKCINELFNYIRRIISDNEEIEIYTCWADEEGEERNYNLNTIIDLKTFSIGDNFELKERQYILVQS